MKLLVSLLALASCLALAGCGGGQGAQVKAFVEERSEVAAQMASKVDASPNAAGVGEARKIFESKKDDLVAKRAALKKAGVGFDLYQQILHAEVDDNNIFDSVRRKHIMELYGTQYDTLVTEFGKETGWQAP